jgi:hypothetical protein
MFMMIRDWSFPLLLLTSLRSVQLSPLLLSR